MDRGCIRWFFVPGFLVFVRVLVSSCHLLYDATKTDQNARKFSNSLRCEKARSLVNITHFQAGGTINGAAKSRDKITDYVSGSIPKDVLTRDIAEAWRDYAVVYHESFASVDSINMNSSLGISLSQRITKATHDPYKDGILVSYGTDTLEETAMFLSLTVTSPIPIVMVGAIRPHTAFSADSPGHFIAAVNTVATPGWSSEGRELVIVIQDKIMGPWGIRKDNNQFLPGPGALLGEIKDFRPFFRWLPGPCTPIKFDISEMSLATPLPRVDIFHVYLEFPAYLIEAAIARGVQGIILVGYRDGYWPAASARKIRRLVNESKVVLVFAAEGQLEYVANARIGVGIPGGG